MRILLTYKDRYLNIGYVTASNQTIVAWYHPKALNKHYTEDHWDNLDFHLTYPINGNYHVSYKYRDSKVGNYYDKKVYPDKVVIKKFTATKEYIEQTESKRNPDDFSQHLVRTGKAPMLTDVPLLFDLPQSGLLINEQFLNLFEEGSINNKGDDIVIDIEPYLGKMITFSFSIYDKNKPGFMYNVPGIVDQLRVEMLGTFVEGYVSVSQD